MKPNAPQPIVHLELHTADLPGACEFYASACEWRSELIAVGERSYVALDLGAGVHGGAVECGVPRATWLPYVEVADVIAATARARELGASVLLDPREGRVGWRSVVRSPAGGEIAFWQPKR